MPKYTICCDLLVPVVLEIEADDADAAEVALLEMAPRELLKIADTSNSAMCILDSSIQIDDAFWV